MTTIKKFSKPVLKKLRVDMDKALAQVAEQYGIDIKGGNWSFTEDTVSMKFEGRVEGGMSAEMLAIELYSEMDTGTKIKYGDELDFASNVGVAKVVAYKTRSPKFPFIVENNSGARYKVSAENVKKAVLRG